LALHFDKAEYRARIDKVVQELAKEKLDGLLMFNHNFTARSFPLNYAQHHGINLLSTLKPLQVRLNTAQIGC